MFFFAISMIIFLFLIAQQAMYLTPGNRTNLDALHPLEKIKLLRIHQSDSPIRKAEAPLNFSSKSNDGDIFISPENIVPVEKVQKPSSTINVEDDPNIAESQPEVSINLHVFYYAWYGSPSFDKKWLHWDHQVRPISPSY